MGQIGLFTRAEVAAMRDRSRRRNYSVEAEEFRRDHERRREWGVAQRHARKLTRLYGSTADAAAAFQRRADELTCPSVPARAAVPTLCGSAGREPPGSAPAPGEPVGAKAIGSEPVMPEPLKPVESEPVVPEPVKPVVPKPVVPEPVEPVKPVESEPVGPDCVGHGECEWPERPERVRKRRPVPGSPFLLGPAGKASPAMSGKTFRAGMRGTQRPTSPRRVRAGKRHGIRGESWAKTGGRDRCEGCVPAAKNIAFSTPRPDDITDTERLS